MRGLLEFLRIVSQLIARLTLLSFGLATLVGVGWLVFAYLDARKVAQTAQKPLVMVIEKADCIWSAALGKEVINPELSQEEQDILSIAAGVAIDREGETTACMEDVEIELIDSNVRLKYDFPTRSYDDLVTKSDIWWPSDLKRPWYWKDRPVCLIRAGRENTIKRLKPIVKERLAAARQGCANIIERAGFHLGGWLAREGKAQARVATYPEDKAWQAKEASKQGRKCETKFRCARRR